MYDGTFKFLVVTACFCICYTISNIKFLEDMGRARQVVALSAVVCQRGGGVYA